MERSLGEGGGSLQRNSEAMRLRKRFHTPGLGGSGPIMRLSSSTVYSSSMGATPVCSMRVMREKWPSRNVARVNVYFVPSGAVNRGGSGLLDDLS